MAARRRARGLRARLFLAARAVAEASISGSSRKQSTASGCRSFFLARAPGLALLCEVDVVVVLELLLAAP